jgi:hypothetical protein
MACATSSASENSTLSSQVQKLACNRRVPAAEKVTALSTDGHDLDVLVRIVTHESLRCLCQVGIEPATQTFIGRDQDQQVSLIATQIE